MNARSNLILDAALQMLRPLVRLMLRHGVAYPAFAAALKQVFLAEADQELKSRGMARTDSAVSLLSGVHRRDVRNLTRLAPVAAHRPPGFTGIAAEVVGRWLSDARWLGPQDDPRDLPRGGDEASFAALVRAVSSDVRPRAVLDELLRLGIVSETGDQVHLLTGSFTPRQGFEEMALQFQANLHDHLAAAAQNLCPVTLELGGKAPAVIAEDFNLRLAAERILFVKYLNAGQICTTVDHAFVPRGKVQEFVRLALDIVPRRYPRLDSRDYSSIIDKRAYSRLRAALDEAQTCGAVVIPLLPGPTFDDAQHRIAPHIVIDAPADCELMQREIFGPILPLISYDSIDEVMARINAGPRPLALYPFSNDQALLDRLIEQVMSGGVSVNDALMHVGQDDLPFGGVGESGMGHYHGVEGFNTFSKLRPVFHQSRWATTKLLMPPYSRLADRLLSFLVR